MLLRRIGWEVPNAEVNRVLQSNEQYIPDISRYQCKPFVHKIYQYTEYPSPLAMKTLSGPGHFNFSPLNGFLSFPFPAAAIFLYTFCQRNKLLHVFFRKYPHRVG